MSCDIGGKYGYNYCCNTMLGPIIFWLATRKSACEGDRSTSILNLLFFLIWWSRHTKCLHRLCSVFLSPLHCNRNVLFLFTIGRKCIFYLLFLWFYKWWCEFTPHCSHVILAGQRFITAADIWHIVNFPGSSLINKVVCRFHWRLSGEKQKSCLQQAQSS